jgi:hypothetical protein
MLSKCAPREYKRGDDDKKDCRGEEVDAEDTPEIRLGVKILDEMNGVDDLCNTEEG